MICEVRQALTREWNETVQQMCSAVDRLKENATSDKRTFDGLHRKAEIARVAAEAARAKVELHRAEHGC
jgi:hypothetical protein